MQSVPADHVVFHLGKQNVENPIRYGLSGPGGGRLTGLGLSGYQEVGEVSCRDPLSV